MFARTDPVLDSGFIDFFISRSDNTILSLKLDRRLLSTQAEQYDPALEFGFAFFLLQYDLFGFDPELLERLQKSSPIHSWR